LMPIDVTIAPDGDLLVCCHGGKPDWGTGPKGEGRLFKISHTAPREPRLAALWPASLTEVRAAFTEALPPDATFQAEIAGGRYVRAGDDVETFRPGYGVVKGQQANAPRHRLGVTGVHLSDDRRTAVLTTAAHPWVGNYGLVLRWKSADGSRGGTVRGDYDFHGVRATWTAAKAAQPSWSGWLPHPNLDVARAWTVGSKEHDVLFERFGDRGTLRVEGSFDGVPEDVQMIGWTGAASRIDVDGVGKGGIVSGGRRATGWMSSRKSQTFAAELPSGPSVVMQLELGSHPLDKRGGVAAPEWPLPRTATLVPGAPALVAPDAPAKPKDAPAFVRGDLERGRLAFVAACAVCHAFRGQGAKVGPDLSNSPERDPAGLREDIVNPSATLNPDYIGYELTLKNETTVIGTIASDRPGRFLVQQPGGTLIEVSQADIKTMRQLPTSLMPAAFGALGDEALRDIITYLITPAGK
jgi:putative heme-binding domain-containing protein